MSVSSRDFSGKRGWLTVILSGLVMTVIAMSLASCGSPARPAPAARLGTGTVRIFSEWLDEAQVAAMSTGGWAAIARQDDIVVLNSWDFRLIPVLKQANPKVQVWVYKDLSGIRSDDCTTTNGQCGSCPPGITDSRFLSSGMGYCWVRRNHPGWLLRSAATGQPFQFRGFPSIWETDYGNQAYQRQWITNVLADVRQHHWDGVLMDNALTIANAYGVAAKYPSDAAVQTGTYSALRDIGPALRRAGAPSVANVGFAQTFPGLWNRWLGPVDGLEQEFYLSGSAQPSVVGSGWQSYQDQISACVAQQKRCWFQSGNSTSATAPVSQYALASFLLATDGRQYLAAGAATSRLPTRCLALGKPLSSMQQMGPVWRRSFAGGVTVVNPSRLTVRTALHHSYFDQAGRTVSDINLGPAGGAVLGSTRPGCP